MTPSTPESEETRPWEGLNPPYRTIVADPPWRYERFTSQSRTPGKWKAKEVVKTLPYSGMDVDDIADLPVRELAAADARLFLWTTNRYLPDAFEVVLSWGFIYKQVLVWHKLDGNMGGSVVANSAEFLLVGVKGKPPILDRGKSAVIAHAQAKTHSQKPAAFADLIEQVSPGPYVELFARQPRIGWDHWGHGIEGGLNGQASRS